MFRDTSHINLCVTFCDVRFLTQILISSTKIFEVQINFINEANFSFLYSSDDNVCNIHTFPVIYWLIKHSEHYYNETL